MIDLDERVYRSVTLVDLAQRDLDQLGGAQLTGADQLGELQRRAVHEIAFGHGTS